MLVAFSECDSIDSIKDILGGGQSASSDKYFTYEYLLDTDSYEINTNKTNDISLKGYSPLYV